MHPRVRANGTVQVYIHASAPGAALPTREQIVAVGGSDIRVSHVLGVIQAWVPLSKLNSLASLSNVGLVTVPTYAVVPHANLLHTLNGQITAATSSASVPTGLAIDQSAVLAMQAKQLQQVGAIGSGVKVGVISDDNSGLSASQAAGYLPSNVWADASFPGTSPTPGDPAEGTAMLEEIHAMAPGASLGFCAPQTSVDLLTCYNDFASWGATVITDDLGFPAVDYFTIGDTNNQSLAYGVASFTQAHPDIAITSAAGNDAFDYFQAPYTAGPGATIGGVSYPSLMDFGAAAGGASNTSLAVQIAPGQTITPTIEWNDPLNTSPDILVPYLLNSSRAVLAKGTSAQASDGRYGAYFNYTAGNSTETDYIEIACQACSNPITIKLYGGGDGAAVFQSHTLGSEDAGQTVAPGVLATAAAWVDTQSPLSINRESYSATGPFLYGDFGATSTIQKPSLAGIDSVLVSGAGGFGIPESSGGALFCGTSATGPNIGALIAALMQANPGNPASYYYSALQSTANQTTFTASATGGLCNFGVPSTTGYSPKFAGSGLAQGFAALSSVFSFPATSISEPIKVPSAATASVVVPVNVSVSYAASAQSGSNPVSTSNCIWTANSAATQVGASVVYVANAAGSFDVVANCPDNNGILSPTPPHLTVEAQQIPAPTVAMSNASKAGFQVTLSGYEPLTVSATSSDAAIVSNSGIAISPSGCGTSTLSCTVSLTPAAQANGTTDITISATDQWGRSGSAKQTETFRYTSPSSGNTGGGGASTPLGLLALLGLWCFIGLRRDARQRRR